MSKHTIILNESLIRLAKGMVKAWEEWIYRNKEIKK